MNRTGHSPRQREFYHQNPYNMFLVEQTAEGIVIRAALDNFSERQKCHFIRHLAAEGFIPDEYEWLCSASVQGGAATWIIDRSWLGATPALMRRKATPYIVGMFAAALLTLIATLGTALMMHH